MFDYPDLGCNDEDGVFDEWSTQKHLQERFHSSIKNVGATVFLLIIQNTLIMPIYSSSLSCM
jgi:hypothetical protein